MLEFKKRILVKVSFDLGLFEKELNKAVRWIYDEELEDFKLWCYDNFDGKYTPILDKAFIDQAA